MEIKLKLLKCSVTDCSGGAAALTGPGFSTEARDLEVVDMVFLVGKLFSESMSSLPALLVIPSVLHGCLSSGLVRVVPTDSAFLRLRMKRMGLENK
jgi:hypothetical protein